MLGVDRDQDFGFDRPHEFREFIAAGMPRGMQLGRGRVVRVADQVEPRPIFALPSPNWVGGLFAVIGRVG